jgi:hypothetical protein
MPAIASSWLAASRSGCTTHGTAIGRACATTYRFGRDMEIVIWIVQGLWRSPAYYLTCIEDRQSSVFDLPYREAGLIYSATDVPP